MMRGAASQPSGLGAGAASVLHLSCSVSSQQEASCSQREGEDVFAGGVGHLMWISCVRFSEQVSDGTDMF